ncbi:phosphomannose isomerase type II C-terminal cupin domain [Nocardioides bruguierae]|uniref:Phosphomannose isomerase type II C-terminal cupin domain n=1 Tax=Nocardioides bruguierae TaxID=2945102 RepID=A0A9X2D9J4_9ACTN|nr:phosphomannose isomerase type II C-terminal cupin domain [Nocardioides bruguierae]MCL8026255.1 phosphomannose isomerase type II C-terminal cupin domain [Nocardioides bruguierae]MCM0621853.1 phosphomannose isomerase type II C-terminal cupin domain [Nocardioides bruguierae]
MIGEFDVRPWGTWHVLDEGDGFKIKRIEVNPGQRLSYQTHDHRAEVWTIAAGTCTAIVDGEEVIVRTGESITVDILQPHRITNMHDELLVVIETQLGSYLGEDDICRLQDDYGRGSETIASGAVLDRP